MSIEIVVIIVMYSKVVGRIDFEVKTFIKLKTALFVDSGINKWKK